MVENTRAAGECGSVDAGQSPVLWRSLSVSAAGWTGAAGPCFHGSPNVTVAAASLQLTERSGGPYIIEFRFE